MSTKSLLKIFLITPITAEFWHNLFFNFGVLYVVQGVFRWIGLSYSFASFTPDQVVGITYLYTASTKDLENQMTLHN